MAGAAVLATAAGVVWWSGVGREPDASARRPGVTVLVNLQRTLVITPGTPLQMEVALSTAPSAAALTIGGWWRPWHEYVHMEDAATGEAAPWPLQFVSATSSVVERGADGSRVVETTGRTAYLEGGRQVHTAIFVAAPATTAQILPGVYRLRATMQIPRWHFGGWRGRAVSALVTITVRARDDHNEGLEGLEKQRLTYAAKYHLSVGQPAEARRLAQELLALRSDDPATLILLGDTFAAENQRDRALEEYRRALTLLPRSNEEPTLLLDRIARASARTR